jgi:hypothetical protein
MRIDNDYIATIEGELPHPLVTGRLHGEDWATRRWVNVPLIHDYTPDLPPFSVVRLWSAGLLGGVCLSLLTLLTSIVYPSAF